jgi:uncharacterized membrane protein YkoI
MKLARSLFWVVAMLMALGICVVGLPQHAAAQNTNEKHEKKGDCDEEEDEDDITEADRASIKFSFADARKIALQRVPGKITDQELEKEKGRLQYAFEIVTADGKSFDVEIDAITGEILKVEDEDDDDDEPVTKTVVKKKVVERTVVAKKPQ